MPNTLPEIDTKAPATILGESDHAAPDQSTLLESARGVLDNPDTWGAPDVNILDDGQSAEERVGLVRSIVTHVLYLDKAILANSGRKFADYVWVENNPVDKQLINLQLVVPSDNFNINGVYDVSTLASLLSDLCQSLPEYLSAVSQDPMAHARQKVEQRLVKEDLSSKIPEESKASGDNAVSADELKLEFQHLRELRNQPRGHKVVKGLRNTLSNLM